MGFELSESADRDVIEIYAFSAGRFGAAQAERYVAGLFKTFGILADQPLLSRERHEFRRPVRVHVYGAHVIVYVTDKAGILIVRVIHGAQNWRRLI